MAGASAPEGPPAVNGPGSNSAKACRLLGPDPARSFPGRQGLGQEALPGAASPSPENGAGRKAKGLPGVCGGQARGYLSSWAQRGSWCYCVSVASCPGGLGRRSSGCSCFPSLQEARGGVGLGAPPVQRPQVPGAPEGTSGLALCEFIPATRLWPKWSGRNEPLHLLGGTGRGPRISL